MCLMGFIKFKVLKDGKGRQYGWKVFRQVDGSLCGEFCGEDTPRPPDTWLKAKDFTPTWKERLRAAVVKGYEPGWHVFRSRKDAMSWCSASLHLKKVVKVLVQGVREKGYVVGSPGRAECFVADEMFIPIII